VGSWQIINEMLASSFSDLGTKSSKMEQRKCK